jgi:hypothetical protein
VAGSRGSAFVLRGRCSRALPQPRCGVLMTRISIVRYRIRWRGLVNIVIGALQCYGFGPYTMVHAVPTGNAACLIVRQGQRRTWQERSARNSVSSQWSIKSSRAYVEQA